MASSARLAARIAVAGALAVCTVAVSACTSSSSPTAPTTTSTSTTSTSTMLGLTTAQAQAALLTQQEVGNGLSVSDLKPQDYPLPCTPNAEPLSKLVPPAVHATVTWSDNTDSVEITETINNYGSYVSTQHALDTTEAGMRCKNGQIGQIPVTIGKPQDLSHNIKAAVDGIEAWAVSSAQSRETVILAKIGTQLVTMVFGQLPGPSKSINAAAIVQDAMAKVTQATQ